MPKLSIIDAAGTSQEVNLDVTIYQQAAENGMPVSAFLNQQYPTNASRDGTCFEQLLAGSGLFLNRDRNAGIRPPTMKDIMDGSAEMRAGLIVREAQPTSRLLFPAVVLEALESTLYYDAGGWLQVWEDMIAVKDDIAGNRFEHPVIDYSNIGTTPKNLKRRSQPIAQGAYPNSMVKITASDVSRKIPTFALGLEATDEAMAVTTLPMVTMALTRQGTYERLARVDEYVQAMIWGDLDQGQGTLSGRAVTARSLDPSIGAGAGATVLTHEAWVRWINRNFRMRRIDFAICTLNTALAIEKRTGRPNYPVQDGDSKLIRPQPILANDVWNDIKIYLVEDDVMPDGVVVGMDSRYAVRRVRNTSAEYSAVEQFVLKKTQAMRFDFGEIAYRLYDEAWDVLLLGDTAFPADPRT